jgi:hypothetical protein
MAVSRDWMAQVRAVVDDIKQAHEPPPTPENEAWRAFHYHNAQNFIPPMEQTPRARMVRAVNRIAGRFSWGPETVAHYLDTRGATYITDLSLPQLEDLHDRMLAYEDSAMHGFSSPDEPPAN